ncbi:M56 family metallopeptidase [Aestuariibaculum marinum]|uniref:Peptidase M56 domain-containing protein n=1 Tax=Aestuariibaculum marinum TaxID=2683592 RepID=A0A8J6PVU9_9FLAO|nr:M56 family metallopeptidase [Aestuariibaculum marinum]MBD0824003.1 hypothetical protein [Aestuariibaculum marinum]
MEYLLKTSAITIIFYIIYKLFLQRETFFKTNRWFLISGCVTAFLIPLIIIPVYIEYTPVVLPNVSYNNPLINEVQETPFNILDYLPYVYFTGLILFSTRFLLQLFSLKSVIIKDKSKKEESYKLIETTQDTQPFSFFNWIVYNPNHFTEKELEHVLKHEKAHVSQGHSIDILVTQIASIILWFNPFIWLYNKAIKQNLEYLADQTVIEQTSNKKEYQYTLLKTKLHSHQMALSNTFYNSLIKKRIVMLHKSKSKQSHLIKYALVIPALAFFLMSFNTQEVYVNTQDKERISTKDTSILFTKDLTDQQLEDIKVNLKNNQNIDFTFSNLIRNNNDEIISLKAHFNNERGSTTWNAPNNNTPIGPFLFYKAKDVIGAKPVDSSETELFAVRDTTADPKPNQWKTEFIINKPFDSVPPPLYYLDGKEISSENKKEISPESIERVNVLKGKAAIEKYGEKGKNGVIEITSKKKTSPWKITTGVNKNVIAATKDTIYIYEIPNVLKDLNHSFKNEPIYILDGKIIDAKQAQSLNTFDIESVSVTKQGENLVEKYGDKAKNGVVTIKSKSINSKQPYVKVVGPLQDSIKTHQIEFKGGDPIFILDGKEISEEELKKIKPEFIESLNVLKEKAAIEKYGAKGKNGVIIITTKK